MSARTIAIIQARMSSSRLPGKVMLPVDGKPLLQIMLERLQRSKRIDDIVLATTTDPSDDLLEQFCMQQGQPCYRGSLHDVLDRYYQAATTFYADVIVRLTADCPLIDPQVLDLTVDAFNGSAGNMPATSHKSLINSRADFAADRLPPPWKRTLPIGLDVEVCSMPALERAWSEANKPYQREHVLPFLYEGVVFPDSINTGESEWFIQDSTSQRGFKVALLNHFPDYGTLRWTVDTPQDLEFVRQVLARFNGQLDFSWKDILTLLSHEPALAEINQGVVHKSAFDIDQRSQGS